MTRRKNQLWLGLLILALLPFAAAAAAELVLRWRKGPPTRELEDNVRHWHLDIYGPFFAKETDEHGTESYRATRLIGGGAAFKAVKPAGVRRIFLIGESVAAEFMKEVTVPLDSMLERLYPGRRFELIGCGVPGYDSYRAALVEKEILGYSPDLVIIMSGNNEYHQKPPNPRFLKLDLRLSRLWLYRRLKEALAPPQRAPEYSQRMKEYSDNLAAMVRGAKSAGAAAAVCTLPPNMADYPPGNRSGRAFLDDDFVSGLVQYDRGSYEEAIQDFRRYLTREENDCSSMFLIGRALLSLKRYDEARSELIRSVECDSQPGSRSPPSRAALVRETSRREGAVLVDLAQEFAGRSPHGIIGRNLLINHVHWYHEVNALAASLIAKALERGGVWGAELAPPDERRKAWAWIDEGVRKAVGRGPAVARTMWYQGLCRMRDLNDPEWQEGVVSMFDAVAQTDASGLKELTRFSSLTDKVKAQGCLTPSEDEAWLRGHWAGLVAHVGEAYRRRADLKTAQSYLEFAREHGGSTPGLYRALMFTYAGLGEKEKAREAFAAFRSSPGLGEQAQVYARAVGLGERQ